MPEIIFGQLVKKDQKILFNHRKTYRILTNSLQSSLIGEVKKIWITNIVKTMEEPNQDAMFNIMDIE